MSTQSPEEVAHYLEWQRLGFMCPYCQEPKRSENGTGSDIACCGERGHAVPCPTGSAPPQATERLP